MSIIGKALPTSPSLTHLPHPPPSPPPPFSLTHLSPFSLTYLTHLPHPPPPSPPPLLPHLPHPPPSSTSLTPPFSLTHLSPFSLTYLTHLPHPPPSPLPPPHPPPPFPSILPASPPPFPSILPASPTSPLPLYPPGLTHLPPSPLSSRPHPPPSLLPFNVTPPPPHTHTHTTFISAMHIDILMAISSFPSQFVPLTHQILTLLNGVVKTALPIPWPIPFNIGIDHITSTPPPMVARPSLQYRDITMWTLQTRSKQIPGGLAMKWVSLMKPHPLIFRSTDVLHHRTRRVWFHQTRSGCGLICDLRAGYRFVSKQ